MNTTASIALFPKTRYSELSNWGARLCVSLLAICPSSADEILHGEVSLQRVRIVDLEGGSLVYRNPAGEMRYVPIVEVDRLFVDSIGSLRDLNEAERRLASGDYVHAVRYYERAARVASGFWERLVRARMIQACDIGDQIFTLSRQFVLLVRDGASGSELAAELLPQNAPSPQSRRVSQALAAINDLIDDVDSQSAMVVLESLRFHIARRSDGENIVDLARLLLSQPIPKTVATRRLYGIRREAFRTLLGAGDADEVLREVNDLLAEAPAIVLPELLLVKAEALLRLAKGSEAEARAGWAAMRVVIHYPDDALAPDALLIAAGVQERAGRIPTALRLLNECVKHDRTVPATAQAARGSIVRLKPVG